MCRSIKSTNQPSDSWLTWQKNFRSRRSLLSAVDWLPNKVTGPRWMHTFPKCIFVDVNSGIGNWLSHSNPSPLCTNLQHLVPSSVHPSMCWLGSTLLNLYNRIRTCVPTWYSRNPSNGDSDNKISYALVDILPARNYGFFDRRAHGKYIRFPRV